MRALCRLLRAAGPRVGGVLLALVLGAATVGSGIGLLATSAYLISAAALKPSIADLGVSIVSVRFFGLARGVLRYLERTASHAASLELVARLRTWFYEAIEPLAPAGLQEQRGGDVLALAASDLEGLQDVVARALAPPAVTILVGSGAVLGLALFEGSLSMVLLIGLALAGLLPFVVTRLRAGEAAARHVALRGRFHGDLTEWVQGLADLVAFGAEHRWRARLARVEADFAAAQRRLSFWQALQIAGVSLLGNLTMGGLLAIGVALVSQDRMDGVHLAAIALGGLAAFESVSAVPTAALSLEGTAAAAGRVLTVVDIPRIVVDPALPQPLPELPGGLSLDVEHLTFSYSPEGGPVLQDVTFSVRRGGRVAIVGPSGAGKSTLVRLLLRFWDYEKGEIRLNGVDLRALAAEEARSKFAVVPQEVYLFDGTVRGNLLLARPSASEKDLSEAARCAGAEEFIARLPHGYDTWIGEHGMRLSGGERQRLAIARALLRDAPLLMLDEPTAHLDSLSEQRLIEALLSAAEGRTLLWITHRLLGLDAMDEILVMDRGQVIERGRHVELLQQAGVYRRLWMAQRQAWEALDEAA